MINFYRKFIPNADRLLQPLYELQAKASEGMTSKTAAKSKKALPSWPNAAIQAFSDTKQALSQATLLSHPQEGAALALTTDASDYAIGAVLEQKPRGQDAWYPLGFFSKKFEGPELRYSAFDRELTAIYKSIGHFRHMLEGRSTIIFTDHKPLTFALAKRSTPWTTRQARHLSRISEFTSDIRYLKGNKNHVADALSRNIVSTVSRSLNFEEIAQSQQEDLELQELIKSQMTNLVFEHVDLPSSNHKIVCDISQDNLRPYIPQGPL